MRTGGTGTKSGRGDRDHATSRERGRKRHATGAAKGVFIVRKTTMISACRPTTRRPFRPSLSPSIWSSSRCDVTRSARWWCAAVNRPSREGGRYREDSSEPMRTSERRQRVSSSRRPGSAHTIRPVPPSETVPTSSSWPRTATRVAILGCASSASRTSRSLPTSRPRVRAVTRTVPAGRPSTTCSLRGRLRPRG